MGEPLERSRVERYLADEVLHLKPLKLLNISNDNNALYSLLHGKSLYILTKHMLDLVYKMTITISLSDRVAELLERVAGELEVLIGRRPSYEEVIELLLTKLDIVSVLPTDVWY